MLFLHLRLIRCMLIMRFEIQGNVSAAFVACTLLLDVCNKARIIKPIDAGYTPYASRLSKGPASSLKDSQGHAVTAGIEAAFGPGTTLP